jgi:hypothetical protein
MRYREIVNEKDYKDGTFRVSINMNNFYKNMELLKNTTDPEQAPSDLEGIDAVVRLGYMGSVGPESILKKISSSYPGHIGFRGQYYTDKDADEIVLKWNEIFQPRSELPGTGTTAHELRHRAFAIMSEDERILKLLPKELVSGEWKDGWGNRNSSRWWDGDDFYSPEHAMIYAVQYKNIESSDRNVYVNNSVLGNRGAEYWRNLYRQVNDAAKEFFRLHFDARLSQHMYPSRAGAQQPAGKVYNIPHNIKKYYGAWTDVISQKTANYIDLLIISDTIQIFSSRDRFSDLPGQESLAAIWSKGHTANIPQWLDKYKGKYLRTAGEIDEVALRAAKDIIEGLEAMRQYWSFVDIRNYNNNEFTQIVQGKRAPGDDAVSKRNKAIDLTLAAMNQLKAGKDQKPILEKLKNQLRELTGAPEDRLNTFIEQLPSVQDTSANAGRYYAGKGVDYLLGNDE